MNISPPYRMQQSLPLHLPQKRHHSCMTRPKDKSQWYLNTLTSRSAMGRVSGHPIASRPFRTTRQVPLWLEIILRRRNERPSRWWHDALLNYLELFYRRNHGRPQENCSGTDVACRGLTKPSLRSTATVLLPPHHPVSNRTRRWAWKQPVSTVLRRSSKKRRWMVCGVETGFHHRLILEHIVTLLAQISNGKMSCSKFINK